MKYQNIQKYCECKLVSIWNAALYHNLPYFIPQFNTPEYNKMCEDFCCIAGTCLGVERELNRLGLVKVEYFN